MVFSSGFHSNCGQRASNASRLKGLPNDGIPEVSEAPPEAGIPAVTVTAGSSWVVLAGGSDVSVGAKPGCADPPCDTARSCSAFFNASWILLIICLPWGGLFLHLVGDRLWWPATVKLPLNQISPRLVPAVAASLLPLPSHPPDRNPSQRRPLQGVRLPFSYRQMRSPDSARTAG